MEILVYIVSFLPTTRDKVKLRYVSQRLRVVSETPSLWSEFIWPYYKHQEERSVMHVLKACGGSVKQLVFQGHVIPSTLFEILNHCSNVTHLCLPSASEVDSEKLKIAVQHLKTLTHLEVKLGTAVDPFFSRGLKKLTLHASEGMDLRLLEKWVSQDCLPSNLVLVFTEWITISSVFKAALLNPLIIHSATSNYIPKDHTTQFKLYNILKVPLNLFPSLPHFQVNFSQTASLPLVKASWFGILGLNWDLIVLTDCVYDEKVHCRAEIACWDVFGSYRNSMLNKAVSSLNCVTEFDCPYYNKSANSILSGHLEQLAVACPNLQRLSLRGNSDCLLNLKGLRTIGQCCHNLCGLNLMLISTAEVENQLKLWEIISDMKLTHLHLEASLFQPISNSYEERLCSLFYKCSNLQALQFDNCYTYDLCQENSNYKIKWSLLAHFPALKYCRIEDAIESTVLQEVISSCKELVCLSCTSARISLSPVYHFTLQQLCIAGYIHLPDEFLDAISAHGRLVHVIFSMKSATVKGITSLVKNSPGLMTLIILMISSIHDESGSKIESSDVLCILKKAFPSRKLFAVGDCRLLQNYNDSHMMLFKFLYGTDLLPLWL